VAYGIVLINHMIQYPPATTSNKGLLTVIGGCTMVHLGGWWPAKKVPHAVASQADRQ